MISDMNEKTSYTKEMAEFFKSLKIQLRVIYALLMREIITRYGRHNIGFAWLFVEPMIFTLGVAALWHATKSTHGSSIAIIPFAVIGYSTVLCWRNGASRAAKAVDANMGLLYHRNVKVMDVFLARASLEIVGATGSFLLLSSIFYFSGLMDLPDNFLYMAYGWFLLVWFTFALAFVVGALFEMSEVVDRLWHALTYLLFPLSGAAFFVYWIPENLRQYLLYLPMVHATEMIRHGYYGDLIPTFEDISYIVWFNMALSFLGLMVVRYITKKLESSS